MKATTNWQMKAWRVPRLDNLELLHLKSTYEYPAHMHEEYSIVLVLDGAETTTCRIGSYTATAGNILLINADEVHSSKSIRVEYRVMKIKAATIDKMASGLFPQTMQRPYFSQLLLKEPVLFRTLLSLHLDLEQDASFLAQQSALVSALSLLLLRTTNQRLTLPRSGQKSQYVDVVRDYLKANYAENVSLADLTSLTNLSPFHLLRIFRQRIGCPPHEYQTQLRIAHARKFLREGRPVSSVALETGFFDQSHFSRNFKRIVGIPPGHYSTQSKIVQDNPEQGQ